MFKERNGKYTHNELQLKKEQRIKKYIKNKKFVAYHLWIWEIETKGRKKEAVISKWHQEFFCIISR